MQAQRYTVNWTDVTCENIKNVKDALCEACSLYTLNDHGDIVIHTDAPNFGIRAILEHNDDQTNWHPCAFLSRNL